MMPKFQNLKKKGLGKQYRPNSATVWSGSTLFVIPSIGHITYMY